MGDPDCSNSVTDSDPNESKNCSAITSVTRSQIARHVAADDFDLKSQSLEQLPTEPVIDSEIQTKGSPDDQDATTFANSDSEINVESCGAITPSSKTQIAEDRDITLTTVLKLQVATACCNDATNDLMSKNQGFRKVFALFLVGLLSMYSKLM